MLVGGQSFFMTRRQRIWLVVAVLFSLGNAAGAVFAAAQGEPLHAGVHVALLVLGAYVARRIWRRGVVVPVAPSALTDRLAQLERSLNALAFEVERVGEGQRFMTRLFTEGAAEPIQINAPGAKPRDRNL